MRSSAWLVNVSSQRKRWHIGLFGADGSTPKSKDRLASGGCGSVPRWEGISRVVRSHRIRGRLDPGPEAYRALGSPDVGHSRRRGGDNYGRRWCPWKARADPHVSPRNSGGATCVMRTRYRVFCMVWRFRRFLFSSNLLGLNTAKEIDSRRLHHSWRPNAGDDDVTADAAPKSSILMIVADGRARRHAVTFRRCGVDFASARRELLWRRAARLILPDLRARGQRLAC